MNAPRDVVLSMEGVSKKFRRGELYDSLRDWVPAMAAALRGKRNPSTLTEREFWALKNVSFQVERGEAFGIIGSNGAGKSTMLKLLSGIMPPTSGSITVRGRLSALIEVSAGFHPDLTGRENVYLNGTILGMSKDEIRRKFDDIVEFAGLHEFIDTPVKRYSSGMYARLGFSVAAHVEPDLLIVDEVLSVGDYLFQQKCVERMNTILAGGATVVFVSHNLHAVAGLCRRSLLLERGTVVTCGATDAVIRTYHERSREQRPADSGNIVIQDVSVHRPGSNGSSQYESGERILVDVRVAANAAYDDATIVIQLVDENSYPVFDTCTTRLGGSPSSLRAGDEMTATFELELNLGSGTYHLNAFVHNYVTDRAFTSWPLAATIFVAETKTVKGPANLFPRMQRLQVRASTASNPALESADGPLALDLSREPAGAARK